jgi:hypothetical protein
MHHSMVEDCMFLVWVSFSGSIWLLAQSEGGALPKQDSMAAEKYQWS